MAELLLVARTVDATDITRAQVGDIVQAKPDALDCQWGRLCCLDTFLVVSIPELSVEDADALIGPVYGPVYPVLDADGNPVINSAGEAEMDRDILAGSRYYIDLAEVDITVIASTDWTVPVLTLENIRTRWA